MYFGLSCLIFLSRLPICCWVSAFCRWAASSNPLDSYITFYWRYLERLSPTNFFLLTFHFSLELSIALRCSRGFSPIRISHFYFSPLTIVLWCLQRFSPIRLSHFHFSQLTIVLWCPWGFSPIRLSHFCISFLISYAEGDKRYFTIYHHIHCLLSLNIIKLIWRTFFDCNLAFG